MLQPSLLRNLTILAAPVKAKELLSQSARGSQVWPQASHFDRPGGHKDSYQPHSKKVSRQRGMQRGVQIKSVP